MRPFYLNLDKKPLRVQAIPAEADDWSSGGPACEHLSLLFSWTCDSLMIKNRNDE